MSGATPNAELSRRLRESRVKLFGDDGVPRLAMQLGIPERTWLNAEAGVVMPALNLLQ